MDERLQNSTKWALLLRLLGITLLFGATALMQFRWGGSPFSVPLISIYLLAGLTYVFTLLSILVLRWVKRISFFIYGQIFYEIVLITAIISITGRIFSFVYILTILSGSILLSRGGAFFAAFFSSLMYGVLLVVVNRWGDRIFFFNRDFVLDIWGLGDLELTYAIMVNFIAFFAVAILSSYLAEQLRRAGQRLKEKEEDLEELQAWSENIVRSINIGLIALDNEDAITFFNKSAVDITGKPLAKLKGKPLSELFPAMDLQRESGDFRYVHPSGEERFFSYTCAQLKSAKGEAIGRLLTFQDQTALREMEEQLKIADQFAVIGQLAAGLAHEIRNPLASISGAIQLLHSGGYKGDEERLMRIVLRETERLNKLIGEFLQFAKPSVGASRVIELKETLSEIVELFKQGQDIGKLKVALQCPEIKLEIDPNSLKQILWNLLTNSAEACNGRGEISVKAEADELNGTVKISVSDNGPGIPVEMQSKIFTPFFTTKEYGTGLGLAIVYRTVESIGGKISVRSEAGRGTTMTVELPKTWQASESTEEGASSVALQT